MKLNRNVAYVLSASMFLSSCVTPGGEFSNIGPKLSSFFEQPPEIKNITVQEGLKLDVVIPVFDPGIPKNPTEEQNLTEEEKKSIWPELRRAEATKFALMMKRSLESTEAFGAVRVTPDQNSTGDLYVLGKIEESNGEDVEIKIKVVDISGKTWVDTSFDHRVSEQFHTSVRNEGKDPYDPVFEAATKNIVESLKDVKAKELTVLKSITDLRFAASFSESEFSKYLGKKEGLLGPDDFFGFGGNRITLVRMPADNDSKFIKTKAIRVRDQLFVDNLQTHYQKFESKMNESYAVWQEQSLQEAKAAREAEAKATGQAVAGGLLIGLAIVAAVAGARNNNYNYNPGPSIAATLGAAAGGALLANSFRTSDEAKVYRDALSELGQSIDLEIGPQVVEFEKKTIELTGDAAEQFAQWRTFLKEIYLAQATPEKRL
ncbi:MAG: hypothetical protein CMM60_04875 [Rhodospirillaceae bacterium]|nr:hypothetical protein [Rhodospirillaceae bacterium]|tara:strand:+ start:1312 stop:2604 length:1293 start_codon:yes stop_codon:yes gene_type:complete